MFSGNGRGGQLNRLVLTAGLGSREIRVLRAYARYLRQGTSTFSLAYVEQALVVTRASPRAARPPLCFSFQKQEEEAQLATEIATALDAVQNSTRTASCAGFSP